MDAAICQLRVMINRQDLEPWMVTRLVLWSEELEKLTREAALLDERENL
jgi:hypothetical protein